MGLITKPLDYTSATAALYSIFNTLKNTIIDEFNGNIDNANIKSGAGIVASKIADTAMVLGNTVAPGTQTLLKPTVVAVTAVGSGTGTEDGTLASNVYIEGDVVNSNGNASDLMSVTLATNTLTVADHGIRIVAWGSTTNDANAKTVSLRWGGQTLITKILTASVAGLWRIEAEVMRTGASTQYGHSIAFNFGGTTLSTTDGATVYSFMASLSGTQTETATIVVKCVADTATTTGIQQRGMIVTAI